MDENIFTLENFNAAKEINNSLNIKNQGNCDYEFLEASLQQQIEKVESLMQIKIDEIDKLSHEICLCVPQISNDAVKLASNISEMEDDLIKFGECSSDPTVSDIMKDLTEYDLLKNRIVRVSDILREAENWNVYSEDLYEQFLKGDIEMIVKRLLGLEYSLTRLNGTKGFDYKEKFLFENKNRAEKILLNKILLIVEAGSPDDFCYFYDLFYSIGRTCSIELFYSEYNRDIFINSLSNENDKSYIPIFYSKLLSYYKNQLIWVNNTKLTNWCRIVFNAFYFTLESSEDFIRDFIDNKMQLIEDKRKYLIDLKHELEFFSVEAKNIFKECWDAENLLQIKQFLNILYQPIVYLADIYMVNNDLIDFGCFNISSIYVSPADSALQLKIMSLDVTRSLLFNFEQSFQFNNLVQLKKIIILGKKSICDLMDYYFQIVDYWKKTFYDQILDGNDPWTLILLFSDIFESFVNFIEKLVKAISFINDTCSKINTNLHENFIDDYEQFYLNDTLLTFFPFLNCDNIENFTADRNFLQFDTFELEKKIKEYCHSCVDLVSACLYSKVQFYLDKSKDLGLGTTTSDEHHNILSVREYITQVGHYLVTFPQKCETLFSSNNSLFILFKLCANDIFLFSDLNEELFKADSLLNNDLVDYLIQHIIISLIKSLKEKVSSPKFSSDLLNTLIVDIEYLINVLNGLQHGAVNSVVEFRTSLMNILDNNAS